jgi:beta-phosphoglucomutase-like phosphatase (HAD superfamily)
MSILDRIGSLAGTEWEQATDFAQRTFQEEMAEHRHTGRAIIETIAAVCREYNNLAGLAVGLAVERSLQYQKDRHDEAKAAAQQGPPPAAAGQTLALPFEGQQPAAVPKKPSPARKPLWDINLAQTSPLKIALQVFGALVLLKLAIVSARVFRRKSKPDVWFAPAAKLRLMSTALAAYCLVGALKSPGLSAWRNAGVALFGTDAIKPLVRMPRRRSIRRAA